jgi:hypothetical protein
LQTDPPVVGLGTSFGGSRLQPFEQQTSVVESVRVHQLHRQRHLRAVVDGDLRVRRLFRRVLESREVAPSSREGVGPTERAQRVGESGTADLLSELSAHERVALGPDQVAREQRGRVQSSVHEHLQLGVLSGLRHFLLVERRAGLAGERDLRESSRTQRSGLELGDERLKDLLCAREQADLVQILRREQKPAVRGLAVRCRRVGGRGLREVGSGARRAAGPRLRRGRLQSERDVLGGPLCAQSEMTRALLEIADDRCETRVHLATLKR